MDYLPAIFIADAPGLDFLNSVATPVDTPVDWLRDGEGLLDWLGQAQLLPIDALKGVRKSARPSELDRVAGQARDLREWFRSFVDKHKGRALGAKDLTELDPLNRLLEQDDAFSRIIASVADNDKPLRLAKIPRLQSPESLLLPIGETLAKFVCTEDFSHVKACEGLTCTLLFADHTRGHSRRWCSMAVCGNRAKQSSHRKRKSEVI